MDDFLSYKNDIDYKIDTQNNRFLFVITIRKNL